MPSLMPESISRMLTKWGMAMLATLITTGIIGLVALEMRTSHQVAALTATLEAIREDHRELKASISVWTSEMKTLEIGLSRVSNNHTQMRAELENIRQRMRDLEAQRLNDRSMQPD